MPGGPGGGKKDYSARESGLVEFRTNAEILEEMKQGALHEPAAPDYGAGKPPAEPPETVTAGGPADEEPEFSTPYVKQLADLTAQLEAARAQIPQVAALEKARLQAKMDRMKEQIHDLRQKVKDSANPIEKQAAFIAGQKSARRALAKEVGELLNQKAEDAGELTIKQAVKEAYKLGAASKLPLFIAIDNAFDERDKRERIMTRESRLERLSDDLANLEETRRAMTEWVDKTAQVNQLVEDVKTAPAAERPAIEAQIRGLRSDLANIKHPMTAAHDLLHAMFGGRGYLMLRGKTEKNSLDDTFDQIIEKVGQRLAAERADDIVTLLGRSFAQLDELTPGARQAFQQLIADQKFPYRQIDAMYKVADKRKAMKKWPAGTLNPEDLDRETRRLDAYRKTVAEYFAKMKPGDVQTMWEKIRDLVAQSRQEIFALQQGRLVRRQLLGEAANEEMEDGARVLFGPSETVRNTRTLFHGKTSDISKGPEEYLQALAGGKVDTVLHDVLWEALADGENKAHAFVFREKRDLYHDFFKAQGISIGSLNPAAWTNDVISWKSKMVPITLHGRTVEFSVAELMKLRNALKRQFVRDELNRGIEIKSWRDKGRRGEGYALKGTAGELAAALDSVLTAKQKAVADKVFEINNRPERKTMLNAQSLAERGVEEFNEPNYDPITRDGWERFNFAGGSIDDLEKMMKAPPAARDYGRRHRTVKNRASFLLRDIFDDFNQTLEDAAHFAFTRGPVQNAVALLKYVDPKQNISIPQSIVERMGREGMTFLLDTIAAAGGMVQHDKSGLARLMSSLSRNIAVAQLGLQPSTVLKHRICGSTMMMGVGAGRYGAEFAARYLPWRLLPPGAFELSKQVRDAKLVMEKSGYLMNRFGELSLETFGQLMSGDAAVELGNRAQHAWRQLQEGVMRPVALTDRGNVISAYLALRGMGQSEGDALKNAVGITRMAQLPSSPLDESRTQRAVKRNRWAWLAVPFIGPRTTIGRALQHFWMARHGAEPGGKAKANKAFAFVYAGVLLAAMFEAAISLMLLRRKKGQDLIPDDDAGWAEAAGHAVQSLADAHMPGIGGRATEAALRAIEGGKSEAHFSMLDSMLSEAGRGYNNVAGAQQYNFDDPKFVKAMENLLDVLGQTGGLPTAGPKSIYQLAVGEPDQELKGAAQHPQPGGGAAPGRAVPVRPNYNRPMPARPARR